MDYEIGPDGFVRQRPSAPTQPPQQSTPAPRVVQQRPDSYSGGAAIFIIALMASIVLIIGWAFSNRASNTSTAPSNEQVSTQIVETLRGWATAHRNNDPDAVSRFYAPSNVQYFTHSNTTSLYIKSSLLRLLQKGIKNTYYDVQTITVTPVDGDHASVTLEKVWSTKTPPVPNHTVSYMELQKLGDEWRIVAEHDQ